MEIILNINYFGQFYCFMGGMWKNLKISLQICKNVKNLQIVSQKMHLLQKFQAILTVIKWLEEICLPMTQDSELFVSPMQAKFVLNDSKEQKKNGKSFNHWVVLKSH